LLAGSAAKDRTLDGLTAGGTSSAIEDADTARAASAIAIVMLSPSHERREDQSWPGSTAGQLELTTGGCIDFRFCQ
jgi:hypothetical protein